MEELEMQREETLSVDGKDWALGAFFFFLSWQVNEGKKNMRNKLETT